jgi:glycerophosphoryl diester phosphodiesterase
VAPLISAHRGSCGIAGLGLADSYDRAARLGADYLEFDARRTLDGEFVVHHDPRLATSGPISGLTTDEYRKAAGDQALTVAELIDLTRGRARLHADLKVVGDEEALAELLLRRLAAEEMVVTTGEDMSVRRLENLHPELRVGLTLGRDWEAQVRACRPDFLTFDRRLAKRLLDYCAGHSLPAWVWTVDEEAEMRTLLADPRLSVLITNRPDLALAIRDGRPRAE